MMVVQMRDLLETFKGELLLPGEDFPQFKQLALDYAEGLHGGAPHYGELYCLKIGVHCARDFVTNSR